MCAFVVLGLVFPHQGKRLAGERLRNDLFCVERNVKSQPVNQSWLDIVTCLKRHPNWFRGFWGWGCKSWPLKLTLYSIGF